ncbi:MAG: hypothetical protein COB78_03570 [Hyphomicrobiales bacterium]|nr:MAG: hypothetical protein COB78_03570 [Hyphomicrobiales bacterium]
MTFKKTLAAATIVLAATASQFSPTIAEAANVELGVLTCDVDGGIGLLIGSKKDLECVFVPSNINEPEDWYFGSVTKIGLDIGITAATVIKWIVLGVSTDSTTPGALAGRYGGVSASASLGIGVGANALIGGSQDGIILQPFSVEGKVGINLAVGLTGLVLKSSR